MKKQSASWIQQKRLLICTEALRALYKGVDGIQISADYRNQLISNGQENDKSLTYGEIIPQSFLQILSLIQSSIRDKSRSTASPSSSLSSSCSSSSSSTTMPTEFVDLGCGTGKAVFCTALSGSFEFTRCWGIELVPGLVQKADEVKRTFLASIQPLPPTTNLSDAKQNRFSLDDIISRYKQQPSTTTSTDANSGNAFIQKIQSIVEAAGGSMAAEQLTNSLCKELGHKAYRAALKSHGKFTSYLSAIKDPDGLSLFTVEANGSVSLSVHPASSLPVDRLDESVDPTSVTVSTSSGPSEDVDSRSGQKDRDFLVDIFHTSEFHACYPSALPEISFSEGDIFSIDWWSSARLVYVASLLFSDEMMAQLTDRVMRAPAGTWVITLKPLVPPLQGSVDQVVVLRHESFFRMSWQMAKVYVYEKIS